MAVKTKVSAQSLVLKLNLGEDKNGKVSFKNLTFKGLKPDAFDQGIYDIADAIKGVLPYPVDEVSKETLTEIENDIV